MSCHSIGLSVRTRPFGAGSSVTVSVPASRFRPLADTLSRSTKTVSIETFHRSLLNTILNVPFACVEFAGRDGPEFSVRPALRARPSG